MFVWDFIDKFFIIPMKTAEGYNPVNTAVYALIAVAAAYLLFKFLKKLNVKIDKRFAVAVAPFVLLGSILRVFQDAKLVDSLLFVTPYLFFWGIIGFVGLLLISLFLEKRRKIPYFKIMFVVSIIAIAILLPQLNFINLKGAVLIFLYFLPWLFIFGFIKFWTLKNRSIMLVHMLDASSTVVALNYFGYLELHVIPNIFISLFGPFTFIPLKLIGIGLILFLIDRLLPKNISKERELSNYLKICIAVIGGFTAARDILRLLAFV